MLQHNASPCKKSKTTKEVYEHQYINITPNAVSNHKEEVSSINNILSRELEQLIGEQANENQPRENQLNESLSFNNQL